MARSRACTEEPVTPTFAVDRSRGRLARWLRGLGFDAVLRPELDRVGLETLAAREGRILLTRTPPAQRTPARATTLILRSDRFREQLREVDEHHPLGGWERRPPRCLSCNVPTEPDAQSGVSRCPRCRVGVGWGGRDARMEAALQALSLRVPGAL